MTHLQQYNQPTDDQKRQIAEKVARSCLYGKMAQFTPPLSRHRRQLTDGQKRQIELYRGEQNGHVANLERSPRSGSITGI